MRLGIAIEDTWDFFHEIYAHLSAVHQTLLFASKSVRLPILAGKVNRAIHRYTMQEFLRHNDVVFFEWASGLLATASHLPKSCGIVTRLHRYELYQWADKINWHAVDKVILVSEMKRTEFAGRFPEHAHKIMVIPEAVSLQRFQFQPRTFRGDIGILSHLRPRKRVYDLVLTFYELLASEPRLHLHIGGGKAAGFDEYETTIRSLVDRLGIAPNVTFYGHVEKPEAWYRNIDILISNSYSEGLQVTPLEAMASGCYALSHRWEGAEDLFPAANLFFTSSELREKILHYVGLDETERKRLQMQGHCTVQERFNVDKTKVKIQALIEEVATGDAAQ
jgi:glycosyltransferase involved in cell wall biosynthesis